MYQLIAKANYLRKAHSIWNNPIIQRYADDNFYAFTRGDILACFTNTNSLTRYITYHSFSDGDKLCNVLYYDDCVTVSGGTIIVFMKYFTILVIDNLLFDLDFYLINFDNFLVINYSDLIRV